MHPKQAWEVFVVLLVLGASGFGSSFLALEGGALVGEELSVADRAALGFSAAIVSVLFLGTTLGTAWGWYVTFILSILNGLMAATTLLMSTPAAYPSVSIGFPAFMMRVDYLTAQIMASGLVAVLLVVSRARGTYR